MDCVVGIDIGTTSTVGILIALPDRVLAQASRPVMFSAPYPGWAEEDPDQWWDNVCAIIPELIANAGIEPHQIKGIGVTGMLPALVLLDADGALLRPSIQQSDARAGAQVAELAAEVDEAAFLQRTGNGVNQQLIAPKLRWIETHEPEVFARIDTVFGSYDFINWKLTGTRAVEQNWALEAGFTDLGAGRLAPDLIALGHIATAAVPPRIASHAILGPVTPAAARATGLPVGVPVVGGAADHIASAFAAGIARPGDVLLKFGGSTDILIATETAVPDARMFLDYHLTPGLFVPNGCMASGGSALNWFIDKIATGAAVAAKTGQTPHQYLDDLAEQTRPGADGVQIIPYFLGEKTPIHDAEARGTVHGLSLNHDLRHLWRALLEGFAFAFRHHIEVFNGMGHETERFLVSDGGSNSRFWMQICADVLQMPLQRLKGHPGSCLGAAWVAAIGVGLTDDWPGIARFVTYADQITPNPETAALYDAGYRRFRRTYRALADQNNQFGVQ